MSAYSRHWVYFWDMPFENTTYNNGNDRSYLEASEQTLKIPLSCAFQYEWNKTN